MAEKKAEELKDKVLASEKLEASVQKAPATSSPAPTTSSPAPTQESILQKLASLKFLSFQPTMQRGKKVTWSCWRESDPAVQGYGNSQQEAHADLLHVEKATSGGKVIGQ